MQRIKKGDEVMVMSGNNKGSRGQVEKVVYDANRVATHVIVTGVNIRIKHTRPDPSKEVVGGRVSKEAKIHISNVMPFSEESKKAERVKIKFDDNKKAYRSFASGGKIS